MGLGVGEKAVSRVGRGVTEGRTATGVADGMMRVGPNPEAVLAGGGGGVTFGVFAPAVPMGVMLL